MIHHLAERIEYNQDEAAWLARGAPEGEEPWREWEWRPVGRGEWMSCEVCSTGMIWNGPLVMEFRRRPKLLHAIDAKGVEHKFPPPMREAPKAGSTYWRVHLSSNRAIESIWSGNGYDYQWLDAGFCQSTEEGAQQQLSAMRAIAIGGE